MGADWFIWKSCSDSQIVKSRPWWIPRAWKIWLGNNWSLGQVSEPHSVWPRSSAVKASVRVRIPQRSKTFHGWINSAFAILKSHWTNSVIYQSKRLSPALSYRFKRRILIKKVHSCLAADWKPSKIVFPVVNVKVYMSDEQWKAFIQNNKS